MWAETGLKASSMVGEVSPEEVADAVWYAITRNRAEIDVMPFQVRAGLKVPALAPGLFTAVARATGASKFTEEQGARQRTTLYRRRRRTRPASARPGSTSRGLARAVTA